jgi:hypothetical protein
VQTDIALLRTREASYCNTSWGALPKLSFHFPLFMRRMPQYYFETDSGCSIHNSAAISLCRYLSAAANAIHVLLQRGINCSALHEIVFLLFSANKVMLRSRIIESENESVNVTLKTS